MRVTVERMCYRHFVRLQGCNRRRRARYRMSVMPSDCNLRALQLGCHAINFDKLDVLTDHVEPEDYRNSESLVKTRRPLPVAR